MSAVRKYGRLVLAAAFLVVTTAVFIIIGARGPKSTKGAYHAMHTCIVPETIAHVWELNNTMIDEAACKKIGRPFYREDEDPQKVKYYPLRNILFYTQIPYMKEQVMSREFEFLIADVGIHFVLSSYVKEVIEKKKNVLEFRVALGYRDSIKGPWKKKTTGNISRILTCGYNKDMEGLYNCDHMPLFELGSCHHKQYIVNLVFPSLPLDHKDEYQGLSQLSKLSLYEIHQSSGFTRLWLVLKSMFFPLTLVVFLWFRRRLAAVAHATIRGEKSPSSLIERFLAFLGSCLVFYNVPFQYLSFYFDCPWLLVLNDFQQGLFVTALFTFWIVFVAEHRPEKEVNSHISTYWKQMGVVLVASIFMFIYEFCERGIQVAFPFYSLWGSQFGVTIARVFIGIASTASFLYLIIFLLTTVRVFQDLRRKQKELSSLTPAAQLRFTDLFTSLRFFLVLTSIVAVSSILTVVLPTELLIHQWQHDPSQYNVYSGILTGNFGMWNAYCLVMMCLYAPSVPVTTTATEASHTTGGQSSPAADENDPTQLQKMLSKQSQE